MRVEEIVDSFTHSEQSFWWWRRAGAYWLDCVFDAVCVGDAAAVLPVHSIEGCFGAAAVTVGVEWLAVDRMELGGRLTSRRLCNIHTPPRRSENCVGLCVTLFSAPLDLECRH